MMRTIFDKEPDKQNEYIHHANSLFHFVKRREFLENIIRYRSIYPRYFIEDISYLNLHNEAGLRFTEAAILGVCFCDIPLSQISNKESINVIKPTSKKGRRGCSHPELYGEYCVGFSKQWGLDKKIRPVHYKTPGMNDMVTMVFNDTYEVDIPDSFSDYILQDIAYSKPISGRMRRSELPNETANLTYEIEKNFYNEQEWRFVPDVVTCELESDNTGVSIKPIIGNPKLIGFNTGDQINYLHDISNRIEKMKCKNVKISLKREEIDYLIVPDSVERRKLIKTIENIYSRHKIKEEMYDLISKIHTLTDIEKDY